MALFALGLATPIRAGIYIPGEEPELVGKDGTVQELPFDQFRLRHEELKAIPIPTPESAMRKAYLKRRAELESRPPDRLPVQDLVSLGECEARLGDRDKSFSAYRLAASREPENFLAQSGLAAIHLMRGELRDARLTQFRAERLRPAELPAMTKAQTAWMLRVEKLLGQLLRERLLEFNQKTPLQTLTVDDLFGVQFVGPSGDYEAGSIAAEQKEKLPGDAVAIVQQLVLWFPHDARLLWLLGELYNANGQIREALDIFKQCMDRGFRTDALKEHPIVLRDKIEQIAAAEKQKQIEEEQKQFNKHPEILWVVGGLGGVAIVLLVLWQVRIFWRRAAAKRARKIDAARDSWSAPG
jgi:tetratricopeptide (TPR) repeat protein